MAKRRLHPKNRNDKISSDVRGTSPMGYQQNASTQTDHEGAVQEWSKFINDHVPGLKFSERPRHIRIPVYFDCGDGPIKSLRTLNTDELELFEDDWDEIVKNIKGQALEGKPSLMPENWHYRDIVPVHEHSTHDEPNPRLYDINGLLVKQGLEDNGKSTSKLICRTFEARLFRMFYKAPRNKRHDLVIERLNFHLQKGGNPQAFIEYVETLPERIDNDPPEIISGTRLGDDTFRPTTKEEREWIVRAPYFLGNHPTPEVLPNYHLLVRYIREWLETNGNKATNEVASETTVSPKNARPQTMPFEREAAAQYEQVLRDEIPGIAVCPFPLNISIGSKETYPNVLPGIEVTEYGMRDVGRWGNHAASLLKELVKYPDPAFRLAHSNWTYASIVPKGLPNPYDVPNPRYYLLDGSMYPHDDYIRKGRLSKAANHIVVRFGGMLANVLHSPLNVRDKEVVDFLEHHYNKGGNRVALVKHVERIIPKYKVDEFQKMLFDWVEGAKDRLVPPKKPTVKKLARLGTPAVPSLESKFQDVPGSLEKFEGVLRAKGLVDKERRVLLKHGEKGIGQFIAAWDAAVIVIPLDNYAKSTHLVQALGQHFKGLTGLSRPGNVRKEKGFTALMEQYIVDLEEY